jgi:hypothetical protein
MGLFSKLFGNSEAIQKINEPQLEQQLNLPPCKTEQELLERYGGIALDKQLDFTDIIGDNNWNVDMDKAEISFGANLIFPIQVLGTISHASQTWLWAWANTKSGLTENVTKQSYALKKFGEENEIDLLRNDSFDFSKEDLHLMGIIASGMYNASAYYIADYGQGAMVVTIKSDAIDKLKNQNHQRIFTVFPQLIAQFDMDHKNAFSNYLIAKGYSITEDAGTIAGAKNENTITGEFDDQMRLINLKG